MLRELADLGTVAAVAEVLSMTPSAVSQQLKTLQREAGLPLIDDVQLTLRARDRYRAAVATPQ